MRKESLDFLKKLLSTPSPSGFESAIQKIWCQYANKFVDEIRTDNYGNAVAILNPNGNPKIMLDAHIDEIGLMVKYINDNGFIYVQSIGGVDPALVRGKRINIHTSNGIVRGVIAAPPIHLKDKKDTSEKSPKMHEVYIDIGAKNKQEALEKVNIGDPATFVDDFEMITKDLAVARAFDDRVGSWAIIEALRLASAHSLQCAIYACSSIQEETGLNGAEMQVHNVKPDIAIAVDVTHATDIPDADVKLHGEIKLGQGPTISIGKENHPNLVKRLKNIASNKKINLQIETFSTTGGTDCLAIWKKHGGIPSTILSIPIRYMHTTVEMLNLKDLSLTAELLASFCIDIKKGETFKINI